MGVKILIEDNNDYVSFYTSGDPSSSDKDIKTVGIRNIYDIRKDVPVVIKSYVHQSTKNFIKICTNDTDSDYPGGSVIKIKPNECALKTKNDDPDKEYVGFGDENIMELRKILLELFKV